MKHHSINSGGIGRKYLLYAPTRPSGLVVFLHGMGGTAAWADVETGWSRFAMREGFALALPEALPPVIHLPPKFLTNPTQWNDKPIIRRNDDGPSPSSDLSDRDDVAFLTAVLDDVLERTETDPAKVFMAGFSNGAGMTFRYAAERADRIAAIAAVAGHCWTAEPKPSRPLPTLYVVGTADPLIPLRGGAMRSPWSGRLMQRPPVSETLERWAHAIGCSTVPITESDSGGIRKDIYPGPVPFQCVTVEGLGHHWPGGAGQLNPRIAGPPSNAVNATELIWDIFKQFV